MATDIDLPYLAGYLAFPESSLNSLLSNPTSEFVSSLLAQVALKAREHEQVLSEKLRLEVELESAVRGEESKSRVLKASVERGLKEAAGLREKLQAEETSKSALEAQIQVLKSSNSTSDSESSTLKARIASLESSNRDTLSLLELKAAAYNDVTSELSAKHERTVELRSEVSKLEQIVQSTKTAATSAKFREQSLQQEIDTLSRSNDWLDSELKTKSAEYAKFRKEKSARLSELQRQNEEASSSIESLQKTEQTLRSRLEEVGQKAEEFLAQAQELREEAARKEQTFRAELDTANRLAELMKESWNTEKQRQQDLSEQLEQTKDDAAEELGRINAEIETEHQDKVAAETRIAELEVQVERLEADATLRVAQAQEAPPIAGRRGTPGLEGSPSRMASPMRGGIRGGISYTQVISDYHIARAELEKQVRRNEKLESTVDNMIREMEAHQPQFYELQADHARLETDVQEMSTFADTVGKERDQAKKEAKKWERQVNGLVREGDLLRQQLRDLSSQFKVLLVETHSQNQGLDAFSPDERFKLEQLAQGDLNGDASQDITATDRFISENLTTFRNISELQEQNMKLLRLTRELGDKMEGEEAQTKRSQVSQDHEELEDLRQKYERCKDEIKSLITQSQSYIRERDMFRRMLSHRGQLPPGSDLASIFGESVNGQPPATPNRNSVLNSVEQSPSSRDMADYAKLLREMQTHFDNYRQETATDRSMLKDQFTDLSKKNGDLRNEVSKKAGEVMLVTERYEMLRGNFEMLKKENAELQKRSQNLSDRAAKQDLRAQQVTEDLVESKGLLESMRNETANLKAEKEFWKSVEKRLVTDNETFLADRDRLNTLNASLQNLLNEREHSDTDNRRRLQSQLETMESELHTTKKVYAEAVEEHKRGVMRLDFETSQKQSRIDDLMSSLGSVREELIEVRTTRDHLQSRVDEMTIELRSAEERLVVLQQKPASEAEATERGSGAADGSLSLEQELAMEVSELKRDLELAQGELSSARVQIEQYKAISQSSEEELRNLNETLDQYRLETDQTIEEKERKIKSLEQNSETLREEINNINAEMSTIRTENAQYGHKMEDLGAAHDAEVARLQDLLERSEVASRYHQDDLKVQAEIAQQAQQNYEDELVKHAEAAKTVQKVRSEHNDLKLQVMELKTAAEAAHTKLGQNEESWSEARERYERELAEIRIRRDDASAQNKLLHQQLESINGQMAELQKARAPATEEGDDTTSVGVPENNNLHELIRYLRREKEIVDVQFDLSSQESKRLRQQLDHTQNQLEEARLKLIQQHRAEENSERHALNHKKLMETIDELNLNRESNSTLRLEKNQLQTSLNENIAVIEELRDKIQPLQARVSELEGSYEGLEQELGLTREARARFEQRYLDVLHRSDSIDPAEFEMVKERVKELEAEKEDLAKSKAELQSQLDSFPEQIKEHSDDAEKKYQESRQKLVNQSKEQNRKQNATIREKEAALQAATQEKDELREQMQQLRTESEQAISEHLAALEKADAHAKAMADTQSVYQAQPSQPSVETANNDASEDGEVYEPATSILHAEYQELQSALNSSNQKVKAAEARVAELERQITAVQASLATAEAHIANFQAQKTLQTLQASIPQAGLDSGEPASDELEALRKEFAQVQEEAETLRAAALVRERATRIETEEGAPSIVDQIKSQVDEIRVELTARHEERIQVAEENFNKRAMSMKTQLQKKLNELRTDVTKKLEASAEEQINKLKMDHAHEVDALNLRHKSELDELRAVAGISEIKVSNTDGDSGSSIGVSTQTMDMASKFTDAEVRDILQKNPLARKLVANSLNNRENKAKEEHERDLNEKLAEAETKCAADIEKEKANAVTMTEKRFGVKMSMAERKASAAQVKISIVEQAANDTPNKPVSEVWAIAKEAKAVPAIAQPGTSASPRPISAQPANTTTVNSNGTTIQQSTIRRPSTTATSFAQSVHAPHHQSTQAQPAASRSQPDGTKPKLPDQPLGGNRANSAAGSGPPRNPSLSALPLPSGGRGPAATGIPQGPGGQRGGANAGRGRGRGGSGIGRGIPPPSINTGSAQGALAGPTSVGGPMSATAKQFVPKKRSAEDSGLEASQYAGDGKRTRGGGSFTG